MAEQKIIAIRTTKTIYRQDDKLVKVFNKCYPKTDILNEALNHARVEETGLNIPSIHNVGPFDGRWSITMDYIPGKTLEELMTEEPGNIEKHIDFFVDLQLKMHENKAPLLNPLFLKLQRKIRQLAVHPNIRYELQFLLQSMPDHDKLCHGDYVPSNVIISDDGNAYIIDWSHAAQGNASSDAAKAYLNFAMSDRKTAQLYLNTFCAKSKTALSYVQRWLPLAAAERLTKDIPEEKQFLMSWMNIADIN